jgi:hypothetical protein
VFWTDSLLLLSFKIGLFTFVDLFLIKFTRTVFHNVTFLTAVETRAVRHRSVQSLDRSSVLDVLRPDSQQLVSIIKLDNFIVVVVVASLSLSICHCLSVGGLLCFLVFLSSLRRFEGYVCMYVCICVAN